MRKIRCAIYTRKSSEDGLEQEFNSLDAQREACAAYVTSQKAEGWVLLPEHFDDGGISGGTLDRPALQRLLTAIDEARVDQIIVYKIDRLTRSLSDFSKIVDRLDGAGASFVSVTQSFNTATSMGRLTLNMLLSFAQFEREVTAERIRDKIAASKRKGLWMGGSVPLGYDADGRTLKINAAEAQTVRNLYDLYISHGTIRAVKEEAARLKLRSKKRCSPSGKTTGGTAFDRGHLYQILTNPIYAGRIRHKKLIYDGQHPAIIAPGIWGEVQDRLQAAAARPRRITGKIGTMSPLAGKLFDETGDRFTPTHTKTRSGKRLRYYVSHRLIKQSGEKDITGWRLPAKPLEDMVGRLVLKTLTAPGFVPLLLPEAAASDMTHHQIAIRNYIGAKGDPDIVGREIYMLINRIDLMPGNIALLLDAPKLAEILSPEKSELNEDALHISSPFQHRKRGVETRLVLADDPKSRDEVLIHNIARAQAWFEQIKAGKIFAEIAAEQKTSKRRVQQMIDLAFLAPDIVRDVLEGSNPIGLTSDWLFRHDLPGRWTEQRALVATL